MYETSTFTELHTKQNFIPRKKLYQKIIWDSRVRLTKSSTFHSLDAKQLIAECDHSEKVYYTSTHRRFNIVTYVYIYIQHLCELYINLFCD